MINRLGQPHGLLNLGFGRKSQLKTMYYVLKTDLIKGNWLTYLTNSAASNCFLK